MIVPTLHRCDGRRVSRRVSWLHGQRGLVEIGIGLSRFGAGVLLVLTAVLASSSCAPGASREGAAETEGATAETNVDRLRWAGFGDVSELQLVAIDEETGIDSLVSFALRGSPDQIDRVLAAADFSGKEELGMQVFQTPLDGVDLDSLTDVRSGRDRWVNASGQTVSRVYVRGGTADGDELIHVWAFTT